MDLGTLVGIFAGVVMIIGSIFMGGSMGTFVNGPGLMIVVGGTFASAFVAFPLGSVVGTIKSSLGLFGSSKTDFVKTFRTLIQGAEAARTGGAIALEKIKVDDPFVKLAFQLVADGYKSPEVQALLQIETEANLERSSTSVKVMEKQFKDGKALDEHYRQKAIDHGIKYIPLKPEEHAAYVKIVREKIWPKMDGVVGQKIMDKVRANASKP